MISVQVTVTRNVDGLPFSMSIKKEFSGQTALSKYREYLTELGYTVSVEVSGESLDKLLGVNTPGME